LKKAELTKGREPKAADIKSMFREEVRLEHNLQPKIRDPRKYVTRSRVGYHWLHIKMDRDVLAGKDTRNATSRFKDATQVVLTCPIYAPLF
jgi:hypothetical protein